MILSFINQKGGVGKTTLSINVASCLALSEKKVLLIDADPQKSSMDWANVRQGERKFNVISLATSTVHKEIELLKPNYDYIIIDAPGNLSNVTRSVIVGSDKIIIPILPSPYDIWAADDIITTIKDVKEIASNIDPEVHFLINQKIANTKIAKEALDCLEGYNINILKTKIYRRLIFATTASNGNSVFDTPKENVAALEIQELTKEITKGNLTWH